MDYPVKPEYITWRHLDGTDHTQITAETKREIIKETAAKYVLRYFVETGTCNGDTLLALHDRFMHSWSIELDDKQFEFVTKKLKHIPGLTLLHGDSGTLLEEILPEITKPALFWLDAHDEWYKGPIVQELEAIFRSGVRGVILIDDMDYITDTLPENKNWTRSKEYGIVRLVHVETI